MNESSSPEQPAPAKKVDSDSARILYCHCNYAQIIDPNIKQSVLEQLCNSNHAFDAVADLCEMAARKDPELERLSKGGPVKIAACFPRAVKWLFAGANAPLDKENTEVLNMRETPVDQIMERLLSQDLQPNLPDDHQPPKASEQPGKKE